MKNILYLGLIFYLPFFYPHDVKQIDITDKCFIERDIDWTNDYFYKVTAALTRKEMADYSPVPAGETFGDMVIGSLTLRLTLNVSGSEKTINGLLTGFNIVGLPPSTVTGDIPSFTVKNNIINKTENVSIRNCTLYID